MNNLNQLLHHLLKNEIEFIVVGGFAAVLHGSSQVTKDLDICMPLNKDTVEKMRTCLLEHHPKHRMTPDKLSFLEHPKDFAELKNLYLQTDMGVLDILGFVGGIGSYEELSKKAIEVEIFGQKCKVICLEDLIQAKKAMGGKKDLLTIEELELIQQKTKK